MGDAISAALFTATGLERTTLRLRLVVVSTESRFKQRKREAGWLDR